MEPFNFPVQLVWSSACSLTTRVFTEFNKKINQQPFGSIIFHPVSGKTEQVRTRAPASSVYLTYFFSALLLAAAAPPPVACSAQKNKNRQSLSRTKKLLLYTHFLTPNVCTYDFPISHANKPFLNIQVRLGILLLLNHQLPPTLTSPTAKMPEAEIPSPSPPPPIPQPTDSDSALSKEDLLEERKNLVKLVSALNDELLVLKKNQETHSTETFRPSYIPNVRRDDRNVRIGEKDMLIRDEVKKTVSLTMHEPPDVVLDSVLSGNKDYKLRQTVLQSHFPPQTMNTPLLPKTNTSSSASRS